MKSEAWRRQQKQSGEFAKDKKCTAILVNAIPRERPEQRCTNRPLPERIFCADCYKDRK